MSEINDLVGCQELFNITDNLNYKVGTADE